MAMELAGDLAAVLRVRRVPHALVIFGVWPLATVLATAAAALEVPYGSFSGLQSLGLGLVGVLLLASDFLILGGVAWVVSLLFAGLAARRGWLPLAASRWRLAAEPLALGGALFVGTCTYFPAVIRHPLFKPVANSPVVLVFAFAISCSVWIAVRVLAPGRRGRGLLALALFGLAVPWPAAHGGLSWQRSAAQPPLVILGLDSLAMTAPLTPLHDLAQRHGGHFYRRAVTPGLITNAVWNSLLLGEPVHAHGVFFAGQPWPRPGERAPLLVAATAAGYHSISVIPDQSSCSVGSTAGFDEDRSGPPGWRQVVLPIALDQSLLLPLLRPLLPRLPFSPARPNVAGTFSYDLTRELLEILTAGHPTRPTLVAAHSAYLHMQIFPRSHDLTTAEIRAVLGAPLASLRDRSFDWLDRDRPDDPLPLHVWKHRYLLLTVVSAIESTRFLDRGGRLIVFSDHGERAGITLDDFRKPAFFHVPLITFHLPVRDPETPISLLDLGSLAGLVIDRPPAPPVVEYAMIVPKLWPELLAHTKPHWDGSLATEPALLTPALRDLRAYRPWPASSTEPSAAVGSSSEEHLPDR